MINVGVIGCGKIAQTRHLPQCAAFAAHILTASISSFFNNSSQEPNAFV